MARLCKSCSADISTRQKNALLCVACRSVRARDPVQLAAHRAVAIARRKGLLRAPSEFACTDCAGKATDYDHREYAKPLAVDPVCRGCNLRRGSAIDSAARDTSRIKPMRAG